MHQILCSSLLQHHQHRLNKLSGTGDIAQLAMASKNVVLAAALLVSGAVAFVAPTPKLPCAAPAVRSASSAVRMSSDEPWFAEAVAVNVADIDELT